MKTIGQPHFVLLFLVLLLGLGCGNGYKQGTAQKLGESFYLAIKNNDAEGYRSLLLTEDDWGFFSEKAEIFEVRSEAEVKEEFMFTMAELDIKVADAFPRMRKNAEQQGVKWEDIEYKGVDVKKLPKAEDGSQLARIKVYFTSNGKDFEIDGKECAQLEGKWVGVEMGLVREFIKE